MFEFRSRGAAKALYNDPEYQPVKKVRQTGARSSTR
jgi:uncharacterized protein (DUF1330 family)